MEPRAGSDTRPTPASWAALALLAFGASLWALFLWSELLLARAGGSPFCSAGGSSDCVRVWDSPFASAVHRVTGLPVAGWGLVWGLVAFGLALLGLLREAQGRRADAVTTATRLVAGGGAVSVFLMLGVSFSEGALCSGCVVTYLLVSGYAGVALFGWQRAGLKEAPRATALCGTGVAAAFLLLLYPGLRTPQRAPAAGSEALPASSSPHAGTDDAERDRALRDLVLALDPPLRQTLSDSLGIYRRSAPRPLPEARALRGPADAPVRITEFTDILCSHCADLQKTLEAVEERAPRGAMSVEARQFPLDRACNPLVERAGDPVRCLAAKVRICLEGRPGAPRLTDALFENQEGLTPERVYALAEPYAERGALEACVASAQTSSKLEDDIRLAAQYDPDGTPIVLVNGRQGTSFGPFLYAMVLARGAAAHPAFDVLPPPNPEAHLH
jgi:serine/threonine-protein kinase